MFELKGGLNSLCFGRGIYPPARLTVVHKQTFPTPLIASHNFNYRRHKTNIIREKKTKIGRKFGEKMLLEREVRGGVTLADLREKREQMTTVIVRF